MMRSFTTWVRNALAVGPCRQKTGASFDTPEFTFIGLLWDFLYGREDSLGKRQNSQQWQ